MTVYRVRLYGEVILTVTSEYHQQRMEHLASQTEAARSAASGILQAVLLQSRKYFFRLRPPQSRKSELRLRLRI
jgi:hypothetical protein